MKGERAYFNIHKLSHDPSRNRFLRLPTLTDGLPGRIQKETMLNICHGSIHHLSGRLRSLFTAAVPCGQFQADHNTCGLSVHARRCQGKRLLPAPAPTPRSPMPGACKPSRSQVGPGQIAFNDIPVVSSRCDVFILNSGLQLRAFEAHSAGLLSLLGDGGHGVTLM